VQKGSFRIPIQVREKEDQESCQDNQGQTPRRIISGKELERLLQEEKIPGR
jgi:hypothetical protein